MPRLTPAWTLLAMLTSAGAGTAPGSSPQVPTQPFVLAYSGWKSALVPIGRYTGTQWVNTWPAPALGDVPVPKIEDIPFSWLSKPVPRQWVLFLEGRPTRITVTGTRRGDTGGCTSPAVLTIARPPVVPDEAYDGGLAVDNGQFVDHVERVLPNDPRWRLAAPHAERAFTQYESRAAGASQPWFTDALVRARVDLAARPFLVDELYAPATDTGAPAYYFVATKRFTADTAEFGIVVSGWIRPDTGGRWPATGVRAEAFGGDRIATRRPLGLVRVIARRFWAMYVTGYESGGFEIDEVTETDVVTSLTSSNGGC